ncbi:MAG: ABC transporter ATP-binding protein [Clostridia bacterium]|nr:ABC transporter ATP-binding protein [Clostridia bacterium]
MLFGKYINKYYKKYALLLLGGLVSLIAVDYLQLLVPEFYRIVVNGINEGTVLIDGTKRAFDMTLFLERVCFPMLVVIGVMVLGRFLWRLCIVGAGIRTETGLRSEMFDHLKGLSVEYYKTNKVGNLMSLFTNDLETIEECFCWGFLMFFDALFLGVLSLYKMISMDWKLTLFCMIPMAIMLLLGALLEKYLAKKWEIRQQAFSSLSDFSQETFSGISVVKAFVKETVELLAFGRLNTENERANIDYTKYSTMLTVGVTLFVESVICVILGYGGHLVHEGVFDAGMMVEFIGYFTSIIWPVLAISQLIEMRSRGKASLKRISALMDAKATVVDRPDVKDVDTIEGDIEFRGLSFSYPDGGNEVLSDVSFHIHRGECVGVVGRTGSGKTTLVDLILRTYNVPDGTVFIDGHDVNTLPIRTVRKYAAYVPQDNFLFSDTIEKNIAMASDDAAHDKILHAAVMADIDENIRSFAKGYETVLGERGVTVSGGQKQRISIARALMKDAPILILDDSVSAVDVKTEKVILENLKNTRAGKTTLIIAHRFSTVENADRVLFINEGKVVAFGAHDELYETCAEYRRAVDLQRLDEEKKGGNGHV